VKWGLDEPETAGLRAPKPLKRAFTVGLMVDAPMA